MPATDRSDRGEYGPRGLTWPAEDALPVSPSDDVDLTYVTRWIYVGAGGDLVVIMANGVEATFANVTPGSLLPIRATRVKATGTTATLILALD